MAAVRGVDEFAVGCDLDVGAGVFCAVKTGGQSGGGVDGDEFACFGRALVGADTVAFFVIKIYDGECGVKGEVAWLEAGGGMHLGLRVRGEFAGSGIEGELINGVGAGVWDVGVAVGRVCEDGMGAALGFDSTEGGFFHGTILCDGMGANFTAAVARPEKGAAGAVGGNVGGVGADVGEAKGVEGFFGVIDAEGGDAVFVSDGDIEAVAIGAEALGTGRAGEVDCGAFDEGTVGGIEIVKPELIIFSGGYGYEQGSDECVHGVWCGINIEFLAMAGKLGGARRRGMW